MNVRRNRITSRFESADSRLVAVFVVLGLLLGTLVLQGVVQALGIVIGQLTVGLTMDDPAAVLLLLLLGQLTFIGVGAAFMRDRLDGIPLKGLTRIEVAVVAVGLAVKFALFLSSRGLRSAFNIETPSDILTQAAAKNPFVFVTAAVFALLLIGPGEEFFFRGAVQGRLRENFGATAAVLIAAFLFGTLHLSNYVLGGQNPFTLGALIAVGVNFGTGVVMGYAYEKTGNLTVPILMHGLFDASVFMAVFFGVLSV